jgi:hypothetical protein
MSSFSAAAPTIISSSHSVLPRSDPVYSTITDGVNITISDIHWDYETISAAHPNKVECGPRGNTYVNVEDVKVEETSGTVSLWGFNSAISLFCNVMGTGLNGNPFIIPGGRQASTIISVSDKTSDEFIRITTNGLDGAPRGEIQCEQYWSYFFCKAIFIDSPSSCHQEHRWHERTYIGRADLFGVPYKVDCYRFGLLWKSAFGLQGRNLASRQLCILHCTARATGKFLCGHAQALVIKITD